MPSLEKRIHQTKHKAKMLKNATYIIITILLGIIVYLSVRKPKGELTTIEQQTAMIQEQLQYVGKLIVTEATYSQIYTYEDTKKYFFDLWSAKKKAIVTVTAKVTVSFDLQKLEVELDEANKKIIIKHIPDEEVNIYPKLDYYDLQAETFNSFTASDLRIIQKNVEQLIERQILKSGIRQSAKAQLVGEMAQIFLLSKVYGWTVEYEQEEFGKEDLSKYWEKRKPKLLFNF